MTSEITSYTITSEKKNKMRELVKSGKFKSMNNIVTTGIDIILAENDKLINKAGDDNKEIPNIAL